MDTRRKLRPGRLHFLLWVGGLAFSVSTVADGFDDQGTHPDITHLAVGVSKLDATLKEQLGMAEGIKVMLKPSLGVPQDVREWLKAGSKDEDTPLCRASNHFHNPLKPFSEAAMSDFDIANVWCWATSEYRRPLSNVTWGTRYTSPVEKGPVTNNTMDWDAARTAYLGALTKPIPADREAALARTFQGLGQVLHLMQDLAVPAHTRNDFTSHVTHVNPTLDQPPWRWPSNAFEHFVKGDVAL